jgi:hypothetical protein
MAGGRDVLEAVTMKVLVADKFEKSGLDGLAAIGCEVSYQPDVKDATLVDAVRASGAAVLVVRSTQVTEAVLDAGLVDAAVARSLGRLREGNAVYGEIVADLLRTDGMGSADLAARLGRPAKDLALLRHRARRRFAALLADELRATVRDASAFEDLLSALDRYLP